MTQEKIMCKWHGCNREAACLPRIYVPASVLSRNFNCPDTSALMGLPLCDTCFSKITAKDLMAGEEGAGVRKQIADVFRMRNAYPNFDKAVVGRVSRFDSDWQVYLRMRHTMRPN